jgi:hypothetical protein
MPIISGLIWLKKGTVVGAFVIGVVKLLVPGNSGGIFRVAVSSSRYYAMEFIRHTTNLRASGRLNPPILNRDTI